MTRQELHNHVIAFAKKCYDENTDPNYDIETMVHMTVGGENIVAVLHSPDRSPMDMLGSLVEMKKPDMLCFLCPIWHKDPITMERNGEGLMIISETRAERQGTIFGVERNPLPVLVEHKIEAEDYTSRVKLLFEPSSLQ